MKNLILQMLGLTLLVYQIKANLKTNSTRVTKGQTFILVNLCTIDNLEKKCIKKFMEPQALNASEKACSIRPEGCDNCIISQKTDIVSTKAPKLFNSNLLIYAAVKHELGKSFIYKCNLIDSEVTCECKRIEGKFCYGDQNFCENYSCQEGSSCYCTSIPSWTRLEVVVDNEIIDYPAFATYDICFHDNGKMRKKRDVPEIQELSYDEMDLKLPNAPIEISGNKIRSSKNGTIILRKDGIEYKMLEQTMGEYIVPQEFLYKSGLMKIFFFEENKLIGKSEKMIKELTFCEKIVCLMCWERISHFTCFPAYLQYFIVVLSIVLFSVLIKHLTRIVIGILKFFKALMKLIKFILNIIKVIVRYFYKIGIYLGSIFYTQANKVARIVNERVNNAAIAQARSVNLVLLASLTLCMVVSTQGNQCNSESMIHSTTEHCVMSKGMEYCTYKTSAIINLYNIEYAACLHLIGGNNTYPWEVKIRYLRMECEWKLSKQYYTFPAFAKAIAVLSCPDDKKCLFMTNCKKGIAFPEITEEAKQWPGKQSCEQVPLWEKDDPCKSRGYNVACLFYRYYLVPNYTYTYEVDKLLDRKCTPVFEITTNFEGINKYILKNNEISLKYNDSQLNFTVIGSYDQGQDYLPPYVIIDNAYLGIAYLEDASPAGQPQLEKIGNIQAVSPDDKNFVFHEDMVKFTYLNNDMCLATKVGFIEQIMASKERRLPRTIGQHKIRFDSFNHVLKSEMLFGSAVAINMLGTNLTFRIFTAKVCPEIISKDYTIKGCHNCATQAIMTIEAKSSCEEGPVQISMDTIEHITPIINLEKVEKQFEIYFTSSKKCINNEFCLISTYGSDCITIDHCLDDPEVVIYQVNETIFEMKKEDELINPESDSEFDSIMSWLSVTSSLTALKNVGAAVGGTVKGGIDAVIEKLSSPFETLKMMMIIGIVCVITGFIITIILKFKQVLGKKDKNNNDPELQSLLKTQVMSQMMNQKQM